MKTTIRLLSVLMIGAALYFAFGQPTGPTKRILFIGNSFTFVGDVPTQVKNIAVTSRPAANYDVEMVVYPGITLEEHLTTTPALARIQEGGWDVVVLQDASVMSFEPHWVQRMERAATTLANAATQQGASVVYYAHWAPSTEADNIPQAIQTIEQTYARLAERTNGHVARAGQVWHMADLASIENLYAEDLHHASLKGAYAAALALTAAFGDVDVTTSKWAPDGVSSYEQNVLRAAALAVSTTSIHITH